MGLMSSKSRKKAI